jgi:osmoprotectant transport system permease protein
MFGIALFLATVIGIIIALLLFATNKSAHVTFNILNVIQTTPALALLVILIPLFGLGKMPTIITSILYAVLPVARNAYAGLVSVRKEHAEIAEMLGLSRKEILFQVRIPLALPFIAAGVRIAVVFTMGVVTLGGLIAAGGLGAPLQTGIHLYDKDIILITALWVAILALGFDFIASLMEKRLRIRY